MRVLGKALLRLLAPEFVSPWGRLNLALCTVLAIFALAMFAPNLVVEVIERILGRAPDPVEGAHRLAGVGFVAIVFIVSLWLVGPESRGRD